MNNLDLYHFPPTPASHQIRLLLGEKGIGWNDFHMNPLAGDDLRIDYLTLDSMGRRPILVHDGRLTAGLSEIIEYIDSHFRIVSLSPNEPGDYKRMTSMIDAAINLPLTTARLASLPPVVAGPLKRWHENRIDILNKIPRENPELTETCRRAAAEERTSLLIVGDTDIAARASQKITTRLEKISQHLEQRPYLMGRRYTIADAVWVGFLCCLRDYHLGGPLALKRYPTLVAYVGRCLRRPGAEPYVRNATTPGHWLRWGMGGLQALVSASRKG